MYSKILLTVQISSYETRGLGPLLPDNWLDHVRVAEEFEVVNRGPITMVYTRQRDASPIIVEPPCNSLSTFNLFILWKILFFSGKIKFRIVYFRLFYDINTNITLTSVFLNIYRNKKI